MIIENNDGERPGEQQTSAPFNVQLLHLSFLSLSLLCLTLWSSQSANDH